MLHLRDGGQDVSLCSVAGSDYKDDSLNLMPFFSASCFFGFEDDSRVRLHHHYIVTYAWELISIAEFSLAHHPHTVCAGDYSASSVALTKPPRAHTHEPTTVEPLIKDTRNKRHLFQYDANTFVYNLTSE